MKSRGISGKGSMRKIVKEVKNKNDYLFGAISPSNVTVVLECGHYKRIRRGARSKRVHCKDCATEDASNKT